MLDKSSSILGNVQKVLRDYSLAVEGHEWDRLPPTYAQLEDDVVTCKLRSIVSHVTQAAGWSEGATVPLWHEFITDSVLLNGKQLEVRAIAEIQVQSPDDDIFLCRLPVLLEISTSERECCIRTVKLGVSSQSIERLSAWRRPVLNAIVALRAELRTNQGPRPLTKKNILNVCLPPIITVVVDNKSSNEYERRILEWAVDQAINRWNVTLADCHRLLRVDGITRANILIEAINTPVAGGIRAACYYSGNAPAYNKRTDTLIRILTRASPGFMPLLCSPDNIRHSVEHELGHAIGLADTSRSGSIMSGQIWNNEMPAPSLSEGRSIQCLREICESYLEITCAKSTSSDEALQWWPDSCAFIRCTEINHVARSSQHLLPALPEDRWMEGIWEGERLVRQGAWQQATLAFVEAASCAVRPSEATLRMHLVAAIYSPNPGTAINAIETALNAGYSGWDATSRVHLHHTLAYAYGRLDDPLKDQLHTSLAGMYRATSHVQWAYRLALENRSPRHLMNVVRYSIPVVQHVINSIKCKIKIRIHL